MTKIARHGRIGNGAADGGTDGWGHGDDERSYAHQTSDLGARSLLEDDVDHQRSRHARSDALDHTCDENHRERMAEDHDQRSQHRERHRGQKQRAMPELAVEVGRQWHGGGHHQQVDGGDPLHGGGIDVEFPHELREEHGHHRLGENADERQRPYCHDGSDEFAWDTFVWGGIGDRRVMCYFVA